MLLDSTYIVSVNFYAIVCRYLACFGNVVCSLFVNSLIIWRKGLRKSVGTVFNQYTKTFLPALLYIHITYRYIVGFYRLLGVAIGRIVGKRSRVQC
jgi:hypothetical protein